MYNNTTSKNATHFLAGTSLIQKAVIDYSLPTENWPYPSEYRFGIPMDRYYCEVWINGMDWQHNYWALEEIQFSDPIITPLISFKDHHEEEHFNPYDLSMLIMAALYYRRDKFFIKQNDQTLYSDFVWPYLHLDEEENPTYKFFRKYTFEHASQPKVSFLMNPEFIPSYEKAI